MSDTSLALAAPSGWRTSAPLLLVKAVLSSKPKPNDCSLEPPLKAPSEGISPQSKGHRMVLRNILLFKYAPWLVWDSGMLELASTQSQDLILCISAKDATLAP